MSITTKKGDRGLTSICGGTIGKDAPVIETLGTIDELNSFLGLTEAFIKDPQIKKSLKEIQKNLLFIGSIVYGAKISFPAESLVVLESACKVLEQQLPPLNHFILPGGSKKAGFLHVCRTLARKAERNLVGLKRRQMEEKVYQYLNRLSDYLFLLARK